MKKTGQSNSESDDEGKKAKAESLRTKVDEKEIAKVLKDEEKAMCDSAKPLADAPDRAPLNRGLFESLSSRVNKILAKLAEAAKLPFVRKSIPELRRLVTEHTSGVFQFVLLAVLAQYEVGLPEADEDMDLMPERLPASMKM
jgi:hypothetical protein